MANSINVDHLAAEIARDLAIYSQSVVEKVNVSSEQVGKEAVKQLRRTSPKDTGEYAKSWDMKTEPAVGQPHKRIVYARDPHHRLTHLLEHGHAKAGGGRVEGKPHVRPAEQEVIRRFTAEVEEAIRNE
jgi:RNA 3'-terminal phosphate cyclase